jgi:transporter family-2 protein
MYLMYLLAALAGLGNPFQSSANAALNKGLAQPVATGILVYLVGFAAMLALAPFVGFAPREAISKVGQVPWWGWVGGLCNALFVIAAAVTTRKIGSAGFTVTTSCVSIIVSLVLDRYGLMGLAPKPLTVMRMVGGAMAMGGIFLVAKG